MARQKSHKPYIYIINSGGCHGHLLTYLINRYSNKTPDLKDLPFNELGNSHVNVYDGSFARFIELDESGKPAAKGQLQHQTGNNIIKITFPNDILYRERVSLNRGYDSNTDLYNMHKDISIFQKQETCAQHGWHLDDYKDFGGLYEKIKTLYPVKGDSVPKWLLRDVYKLGFLDWSNLGGVKRSQIEINEVMKLAPNNKVKLVEVNSFFTLERLESCLMELDKEFDLGLELHEVGEVYNKFREQNKILMTDHIPHKVLEAVKNKQDMDIPELDIIQEAYVYAQLEESNDFISMPLVDTFWKNTRNIINYIDHYPDHYKAMNPNLPKFNNIDNPFFLHRQKNK